MSVLFIAEDDPLMSRMYERAFRLGGHELKMAFDGEEALRTLQAMNPTPVLIMLDVMMPKMSGFDVLRKIKEDEKLKTIPVILLTNLAGAQDAEKGLELGAVMYLVKSQYNPKQIVEKVEEIIKASSRGEGVPEVKVEVKDIPVAPAAPVAPATPPAVPPAPAA
jgi:DNA-binding response OmpR family regulator